MLGKIKALVIVAHPDDELIWMGGFILKNREWDFDIITLCRKSDPDRAHRFTKVCEAMNVKYCNMGDLEDDNLIDVRKKDIIQNIKSLLKNKNYDYIFTHGYNGEYGHKRHRELFKAVNAMIKIGELKCRKVFYFSYQKNDGFCHINLNADKFIRLDNSTFSKKKELIVELYGFPKGGFEEECCGQIEAFNTLKIK